MWVAYFVVDGEYVTLMAECICVNDISYMLIPGLIEE